MPEGGGEAPVSEVDQSAPSRLRRRVGAWRSELLLAAVVALVVVPVLQPLMAQQISRYALTASMADSGTVSIEEYRDLIGVDRAERDGVLYSDKAPGQPVLAIPAYLAYRAMGGEPATEASGFGDLGLWAVSLVSAALPAVALAVLMRRFALRFAPERATEAALALSLGTMLLPFGTVLFSHVLSALAGLAAYLLTTGDRPSRGRLAAAGAMAGFGVTVEYTLGILAILVGAVVLVRAARSPGATSRLAAGLHAGSAYALGGLPFALLLGWYHTAAFGGPFEVGYRYSQFTTHQGGIVGVRPPLPGMTAQILLGERGLFVLTPIALVGAVGLVVLLLRRIGPQADAWAALIAFGAFVSIAGGWDNPWAGASPGPRYITPGLPFLAGGVAYLWQRRPVVSSIAALASSAAMGVATFTMPLAQPTEPSALLHWVARAREGRFADTLLTARYGDWALMLPLVAALALTVVLLRSEAADRAAAAEPVG
jgi:hypothetical protein